MQFKEKKGPHHRFIQSWSMGMNDYEIARSFGIDVETLRAVKRDLNSPDDQAELPVHFSLSDQPK